MTRKKMELLIALVALAALALLAWALFGQPGEWHNGDTRRLARADTVSMFDDAKPELEAIEQRLVTAIDFQGDHLDDTFAAILNVFTFTMSLACPDCRKVVAKQLRKHVPQMLTDANRLAAMAGPTEPRHIH